MAQLKKFNDGRARWLISDVVELSADGLSLLRDEENIYLLDWTTLHFDLLAEEKSLHKCGAVELE